MRIALRALAALLFSLLLVAGCGQKGALYLPGNPSTMQTEIPPQVPGEQTDAESEEEEEDDDDDDDN